MATLEKQLKLMETLRDLLKKETSELSEVHLEAMAEIHAQKEAMADSIKSHASTLREALQEAASREGLSSRAALGELAACLSKKGNQNLAQMHAELNAIADQTKELLNLNREIAQRFVVSVGNSLDYLARIINQTSTYGASGSYQQRPTGAVLINREA
jgi:flagellar biosynthesis/type III secretory pathway chaperone